MTGVTQARNVESKKFFSCFGFALILLPHAPPFRPQVTPANDRSPFAENSATKIRSIGAKLRGREAKENRHQILCKTGCPGGAQAPPWVIFHVKSSVAFLDASPPNKQILRILPHFFFMKETVG